MILTFFSAQNAPKPVWRLQGSTQTRRGAYSAHTEEPKAGLSGGARAPGKKRGWEENTGRIEKRREGKGKREMALSKAKGRKRNIFSS